VASRPIRLAPIVRASETSANAFIPAAISEPSVRVRSLVI